MKYEISWSSGNNGERDCGVRGGSEDGGSYVSELAKLKPLHLFIFKLKSDRFGVTLTLKKESGDRRVGLRSIGVTANESRRDCCAPVFTDQSENLDSRRGRKDMLIGEASSVDSGDLMGL